MLANVLLILGLAASPQSAEPDSNCTRIVEMLYVNSIFQNSASEMEIIDSLSDCAGSSVSSQISTAEYYINQSQYDKAEQELKSLLDGKLLDRDPAGKVSFLMSKVYYFTSEFEKSEYHANKAIENGLLSDDVYFYHGYALFEQGKFQDAMTSYEMVMEMNPNYKNAWNNYGVCLDRLGRNEESLKYYQKADELARGNDPLYVLNKAKALKSMKRMEEAFEMTEMAFQKFPQNEDIIKEYAYHLSINGRLKESIEVTRNWLKMTQGKEVNAYFRLGYCYDELGQDDSALYYYNKSLRLNLDQPAIYLNAGMIYNEIGYFEKGEKMLMTGLKYDPNHDGIYNSIVNMYTWQHRFDKSLKWATKYYDRFPTDDHAPAALGYTLLQLGRYEEAIPYFELDAKMDPEDTKPYNNMARCYAKLGQHEKALMLFDKALGFDPENSFVYHNRASMYCELGQYQKACEDLRKSIDLQYNWIIDSCLIDMREEFCADVSIERKILRYEFRGNSPEHASKDFIRVADAMDSITTIEVDTASLMASKTDEKDNSGVNRDKLNSKISLYPNPSDGQVTIEMNESEDAQYTVRIFDISGSLVYMSTETGLRFQMDLNELSAGQYAILVLNAGQIVASEKLILN